MMISPNFVEFYTEKKEKLSTFKQKEAKIKKKEKFNNK